MQDAVSGQNLAVIFRREEKAANDMIIMITVLMLCLAPAIAANIFKRFVGDQYGYVYVWSTTFPFVYSSINPLIYLTRNSELKNALKSTMCF